MINKDFSFVGKIASSKSIMNRSLIVQSFFPSLILNGSADCDDVRHLRQALQSFQEGGEIWCGEGGTTFRFLALRASREPGKYTILADPKLLARPQQGLVDLLKQLNVEVEMSSDGLNISGNGWRKPENAIIIDMAVSSQFASALVLSAWDLDFDLDFELKGHIVSESYFSMTLKMVNNLGMEIEKHGECYKIPAKQKIKKFIYEVESDVSSIFSVAALGLISGKAEVSAVPTSNMQPDIVFLEVLKGMEACFHSIGTTYTFIKTNNLKAIRFNLKECPDLFPVLAVLCAFADGSSHLYGAPHLSAKESNRIEKVAELLGLLGVKCTALFDGIKIEGSAGREMQSMTSALTSAFDPAGDHRMVMAAVIANSKTKNLEIKNASCVSKSFPEFLEIAKGFL